MSTSTPVMWSLSLQQGIFTAGLFHGSRVTGHGSQVTGHRSRVTGHGSRVTGHWSQVTGHGSRVTGHGSRVTGHGSRVTGHRSRVTGHRFMSTSTPVMWSLSLQQGIFSVYLVLDRRLCRHVAIVGARSRAFFWGK